MKATKASHFWNWFRKNQHHYINLLTQPPSIVDYWFKELEVHLTAFHRFLVPVLQHHEAGANKPFRFIVSADGRAASFNIAEKLVAKAPDLPAFELMALEPPAPFEQDIEMRLGDCLLQVDNFRYKLCSNNHPGKLTIQVFIDTQRPLTDEHHRLAIHAVYNLVGERVFGREIKYIETFPLHLLAPSKQLLLKPLQHLARRFKVRNLP